jgi:hypothetical protein
MDTLKEDVVVHSIKGLLDVEEEDGTLKDIQLSAGLQHALDRGEEGVYGVDGGSTLAEPELEVCEVTTAFQLFGKATVYEVLEGADNDGGHADGTIGARLALIACTLPECHDVSLPPGLGSHRVCPREGEDGGEGRPCRQSSVFEEQGEDGVWAGSRLGVLLGALFLHLSRGEGPVVTSMGGNGEGMEGISPWEDTLLKGLVRRGVGGRRGVAVLHEGRAEVVEGGCMVNRKGVGGGIHDGGHRGEVRWGSSFEHTPSEFGVLVHHLLAQVDVGLLLGFSTHFPPGGPGRAEFEAEGEVRGIESNCWVSRLLR